MKTGWIFFFAIAFALSGVAQTPTVEANFEKNKAKYTREYFSMGEDASSGYDYLFYKKGGRIVKLRSIWSASWSKELRVDDFFFDGDLVLLRRHTAPKTRLGLLKRGRTVVLKPKEEMHFTDKKLTKWIVGGKAMASTDPKWKEKENEALEQAAGELESYTWLKEDKPKK